MAPETEVRELVRFTKASRPYNVDETAAFTPQVARRLVATLGCAVYVCPPEGYDENGNRLVAKAKAKAEAEGKLPEGIRHNGGGWYQLLDFTDPATGKPYSVQGRGNAIAKNEDLIAAAAATAENPDKDDGEGDPS
jgi:hypothetical protein